VLFVASASVCLLMLVRFLVIRVVKLMMSILLISIIVVNEWCSECGGWGVLLGFGVLFIVCLVACGCWWLWLLNWW